MLTRREQNQKVFEIHQVCYRPRFTVQYHSSCSIIVISSGKSSKLIMHENSHGAFVISLTPRSTLFWAHECPILFSLFSSQSLRIVLGLSSWFFDTDQLPKNHKECTRSSPETFRTNATWRCLYGGQTSTELLNVRTFLYDLQQYTIKNITC